MACVRSIWDGLTVKSRYTIPLGMQKHTNDTEVNVFPEHDLQRGVLAGKRDKIHAFLHRCPTLEGTITTWVTTELSAGVPESAAGEILVDAVKICPQERMHIMGRGVAMIWEISMRVSVSLPLSLSVSLFVCPSISLLDLSLPPSVPVTLALSTQDFSISLSLYLTFCLPSSH